MTRRLTVKSYSSENARVVAKSSVVAEGVAAIDSYG
jgi:hypothetical protein